MPTPSNPTARSGGFTLLEVLIAMSILIVFMGGAMGLIVNNNKIALKTTSRLNATQSVRGAMDRLQPYLRRANRLVISNYAIPSDVQAAAGGSHFPNRVCGPDAVIIQVPVFNKATGALTSANSCVMLHYSYGGHSLKATYAILNPDGTLNYKKRDEVISDNSEQPRDRNGALLNWFTYYDETGAAVTPTMANINNIVRVKISVASEDTTVIGAPKSQSTTEIRLANQSTRKDVSFLVYNSFNANRVLDTIDITGPSTATLTRVDFGTVSVWSNSPGQLLSSSTPQIVIPSPKPSIGPTSAVTSKLWFAQNGTFAGTYGVRFTTTAGESLSTTFTHTNN